MFIPSHGLQNHSSLNTGAQYGSPFVGNNTGTIVRVCVCHMTLSEIFSYLVDQIQFFFVRKIPLSSVESILIFKGGLFSVACQEFDSTTIQGRKNTDNRVSKTKRVNLGIVKERIALLNIRVPR